MQVKQTKLVLGLDDYLPKYTPECVYPQRGTIQGEMSLCDKTATYDCGGLPKSENYKCSYLWLSEIRLVRP